MPSVSGRNVRRAPVLAVVAGALVAGALADRAAAPAPAGAAGSGPGATVQPVPVAAPAAALSSSWFCAGAPGSAKGGGTGSIVVANSGSATATGTVTVIGTSGARRPVPVTVGPYSSTTVDESVPGAGSWAGAVADIDAGSVAVAQVVDGPGGRSVSACATSGSGRWYFPTGQTRINADQTILLLNPYPTDSIVDLSFTTDQGLETPQDFQGVDVPPGGLVALDLRSHLRRRAAIATTVSARNGSVVAWQATVVSPPAAGQPLVGTPAAGAALADPALPVAGTAVTLGAPSAGTEWVWPDGLAGSGLDEQYVVYNPGPDTAQLRLSVGLDQGSAEPFTFPIGPGQVVPIISEQQARIPAGVAHSATLVSTNGVPVVAVRTVTAANALVGTSTRNATHRNGIGVLGGGRLAATGWLVPAAATDAHHAGSVVVYNPGDSTVTVTLDALHGGTVQSLPGGTGTVAAGRRASVAVPAGTTGPVTVRATGPVYVEYDLYATTGTGLGLSMGVPLS